MKIATSKPPIFLKHFTFLLLLLFLVQGHAGENEWKSLFNGKDLKDWVIKIAGQEAGVNYKNTFRAEDGILRVSYEDYEKFEGDFGHIFYKTPFENYHFRAQYRFLGDQTPGAPDWAFRNSGLMFHAQDPFSMRKDQAFPVCLELQTLGGNGKEERATGNLCTPGSHVHIDGKLDTRHCIFSNSPTYHGDQWVNLELIVEGDNIQHIINGKTVFSYTRPVLDDKDEDALTLIKAGHPIAMHSGYIALQAEGHNVDYRNIEIKLLSTN